MKNQHSVDIHYTEKNLSRIVRDLKSMPADELSRALLKLAATVDSSVFQEPEFARHTNATVEPAALRFPTMLRKMWSGGEVQDWIGQQGDLYRKVVGAGPERRDSTSQ